MRNWASYLQIYITYSVAVFVSVLRLRVMLQPLSSHGERNVFFMIPPTSREVFFSVVFLCSIWRNPSVMLKLLLWKACRDVEHQSVIEMDT